MEKLQQTEDIFLSLDGKLNQLAVISKSDPAYRVEREEIQMEMKALYETLSEEKLDVEVGAEDNGIVQDKGLLGVLTGTVDLMKNLLLVVKVSMHRESDADRVLLALEKKGLELLPGYGSLYKKALEILKQFVQLDVASIVMNLRKGSSYVKTFASYIPSQPFCPPEEALLMAECSEYAYTGYTFNKKVSPLKRRELPECLKMGHYDEVTGQLYVMNGFKVWLGRYEDRIVIAFAGTELSKIGAVLTDVHQLLAADTMYLYAVGLVRLFLETYPEQRFYVTGHSLGGGLTQFAVATNIALAHERMKGIGFNAAGLSASTLSPLDDRNLQLAMDSVVHYATIKDPVSVFGAAVGLRQLLPKGKSNGHSLDDVKDCLQLLAAKK